MIEIDNYDYRLKYVEIFIDETGYYIEYDHKKKMEIVRRKATQDEVIAFGNGFGRNLI